MLREEPESRQNSIVARIFSVLGMKFPEDDEATDELLAEWREELANLTIDDIAERVRYWKARGATCPADEFAKAPGQKPDKMSTEEMMDKAGKLYKVFCTLGEPDMTFEESYDFLELGKRWGSLPEGRRR